MNTFAAVVSFASLLALPPAPGRSSPTPRPGQAQDACALLTEDQISAAIEVKTLPGKHGGATSTKTCIWSDDPNHGIDHRRVTLGLTALAGFDVGKQVSRPKAEPVSGVGDDAYYEFFGTDAPTLVVKKGGSAFNVRILNGLKLKPIDMNGLKAKELELAKAAVAKL